MKKQFERLLLMTDENGIVQHSDRSEPDLSFGYSIDDSARALDLVSRVYPVFDDGGRYKVYFDFIKEALRGDGYLNNYKDGEGEWIDAESPSEDNIGRSLQGLATFISSEYPRDERDEAEEVFMYLVRKVPEFEYPVAMGISIVGMANYLIFKNNEAVGKICREASSRFLDLFERNSDDYWKWVDGEMTYDVGKVPQSFILSSAVFNDKNLERAGLECFGFLERTCFENGFFEAVGNRGWFLKGGEKALYDEQSVEAGSVAESFADLYYAKWNYEHLKIARRAFSWFEGDNKIGRKMMDEKGGIYDGFAKKEVNENQGAESLLSYLLSFTSLRS